MAHMTLTRDIAAMLCAVSSRATIFTHQSASACLLSLEILQHLLVEAPLVTHFLATSLDGTLILGSFLAFLAYEVPRRCVACLDIVEVCCVEGEVAEVMSSSTTIWYSSCSRVAAVTQLLASYADKSPAISYVVVQDGWVVEIWGLCLVASSALTLLAVLVA